MSTDNEISTHYSVLNCDEKASKEEIRRQYKKLALMTHPDKCEAKTSSEDFHRIDKAVKVLDNDLSRRQYDSQLIDVYEYSCRCGGSYLVSNEDMVSYRKQL
ncbi:unnamed protein product, partial [Medioppia subpectinata]